MNILPSSAIDRNVASRDPFPDGLADRTIGTDSRGADISLSDLDPNDLDEWLGRLDRSRPLDATEIPAERYLMPRGMAEFLAYPPCPLD